MRQLKFKGFTLIELLIVVAIIAILAAIAVPNFLEAQVRSKVSRAKNDIRSVATALEAYYVDNNSYPSSARDNGTIKTVNSNLTKKPARERLTFELYMPNVGNNQKGMGLTTPVAFMSSMPSDPFADTKGNIFGYWNAMDLGWIMWSYGPDTDESTSSQIELYLNKAANAYGGQNSVYNPYVSNPTVALQTQGTPKCYTYDPTNGTVSPGDIYRVKG